MSHMNYQTFFYLKLKNNNNKKRTQKKKNKQMIQTDICCCSDWLFDGYGKCTKILNTLFHTIFIIT